jgi:hypothetical protein
MQGKRKDERESGVIKDKGMKIGYFFPFLRHNKTGSVYINAILRRVREIIVVVKKQRI